MGWGGMFAIILPNKHPHHLYMYSDSNKSETCDIYRVVDITTVVFTIGTMQESCHGTGMCFTRGVACCHDPPCVLIPCTNFKFCGRRLPGWIISARGDLCSSCDTRVGTLDIFQASQSTDPCPICYESTPDRVRMICGNASHSICMPCFRKPDSLYFPHLTANSFGCVYPFPLETKVNVERCANNRQYDAWKEEYPMEYSLFVSATNHCEDQYVTMHDTLVETLSRCPLCRGASPWASRDYV
jgi:hypothetical protein